MPWRSCELLAPATIVLLAAAALLTGCSFGGSRLESDVSSQSSAIIWPSTQVHSAADLPDDAGAEDEEDSEESNDFQTADGSSFSATIDSKQIPAGQPEVMCSTLDGRLDIIAPDVAHSAMTVMIGSVSITR